MATTTIYADLIQIIDSSAPDVSGTAASIGGAGTGSIESRRALVHFPFPAALSDRQIDKIELHFYSSPLVVSGLARPFTGTLYTLSESFDAAVTYNTAPETAASTSISGASSAGYSTLTIRPSSALWNLANILSHGVEISASGGGPVSTSVSSNPPYIIVTHSENDYLGAVTGTPTGGYLDKGAAKTFRWTYTPPENTLSGAHSVASSRFGYKGSSSDAYTYISVGSAMRYTAPANTFATDSVYWLPEITLDTGQTLQPAAPYVLTTVEPAFTAVAVSPDGTIEDGSAPITFAWTAYNSVGSTPSGAELQYNTDGSTWATLGSVSGSVLIYEIPSGTLPGGQISWRVRALNNSGTPGSWSSALTFLNVAAPAAPAVSSDAVPFATITWSAENQQAYELLVDGASYGVRFGGGKSFTLPQPLADGNHTAEVRIQGLYGLWSQPGSVTFTVSNAPAGTIDLGAQFGIDAELFWSSTAAGEDFLVYRDGVQIGHTAEQAFTDRRALGVHEWTVLLRQADGNYTRSNAVTGVTETDGAVIAPLAGGPWLSLRLTETSTPARQLNFSRSHSLRHFSGSALPVLELTPYENKTVSLQCAFKSAAEALAFEALWGQVVILKVDGRVIIGGLMNLDKAQNVFYIAYAFTIEQIAVEEVVDG